MKTRVAETYSHQHTEPRPEDIQTAERRAFVRYPRRLEKLWQILGIVSGDKHSASVVDLSITGVGLVTDCEFAPETLLVVRLPCSVRGWQSYFVRVCHCKPHAERFQVGCMFVKPLTGEQLRTLLW